MKVHIMDLQIGDRLTSDVFNNFGLNILSMNTSIGAAEISKLLNHNIEYVDVDYRTLEIPKSISNSPTPVLMDKVKPVFDDACVGMKELFDQAFSKGIINDKTVNESFQPLVETVSHEKDFVSLLLALNTKDDYTYQHCVQVGMISYFIAKWTGQSEEEAIYTGKAGYLHDIGKSKITDSILKKPGKLTNEEYTEIKNHTLYGHEIINRSINDPIIANVALEHHERTQGNGYPYGIKGDEMHALSKIVAVADVYSAMISSRVYQKQRDLLNVLKELYKLSFSELEPNYTHTFIRNMLPSFIGKKVTLTNSTSGIIVMTNPTNFFRPLIKTGEQFIDLALHTDLEIEKVLV